MENLKDMYAKYEKESKEKSAKNTSGVSSDMIRKDIMRVFNETKMPKLLLSAAIQVVKEVNVARYKDVNYSTFRAAVQYGKMFKMEKDTQERVWLVKVTA
jgi:hypothetical protein